MDEALKSSEKREREDAAALAERLSFALGATGAGWWEVDYVTDSVRYSALYREILGYASEEEFPDTTTAFEERVHPEDLPRITRAIHGHFENDDPYDLDIRIRAKSGDYQWVRARAKAVRGEGGRVMRLVGTIVDIGWRKGIQEALEKEQVLFHALMENVPVNMYFKDTESRFTRVNQSMADWLGEADPRRIVGKTDADFFEPEHAEKALRDEQQIMRDGNVIHGEVEKEIWLDRPETWVLTTKLPLFDARGMIVGTFGISNDVTEQVKTQHALERTAEELVASNRDLEQFAYAASHDLKEPLRMVASYLTLLEQRYKGKLDQDAEEFIGFAVDGAKRMQRLITDLLGYSRVGARGKAMERTNADECLDAALANLQVAVAETGARITRDPLPLVMADPAQIVQLFQNLIGNALKFRGDRAARVHVSAAKVRGSWEFAVRDEGIGIDPAHADRIFLIFQRLNHRDDYDGTGMGLAICKRIVERHGGQIWVESAPEKGATFSFNLAAAPGGE